MGGVSRNVPGAVSLTKEELNDYAPAPVRRHATLLGMDGIEPRVKDDHQPPLGYQKAAALRRALDRALARWRVATPDEPQYLALPVLTGALRYVQAGYRLNDSHLELILRSALYHEKGVLSALQAQRDADTIATSVVDALLDKRHPLSLGMLWRMQRAEHTPVKLAATWQMDAAVQLRAALPNLGLRQRTHAAAALYQLETGLPILEEVTGSETQVAPARQTRSLSARMGWFTIVAAIVLLLVAAWIVFRPNGRSAIPPVVTVPRGDYVIGETGDALRVFVDDFAIMLNEVTNQAYRECVAAGTCRLPATPDSAQRVNYFFDPTYDQHPVIHVTWTDAAAYCAWRGMRLPTAREWEVAASHSPLTGRRYRYPWGDHFDASFANFAGSGYGDSRPVGSYHPAGNSFYGLRDMAGNVAEWTGSPSGASETTMIVKGGSFLDSADDLAVYRAALVPPDMATAWLGFRCAR
jgi:formylglycine-generating enzyme required for sulfatase activity